MEYSWFEFRIFLLNWLPYQDSETQSALLFAHNQVGRTGGSISFPRALNTYRRQSKEYGECLGENLGFQLTVCFKYHGVQGMTLNFIWW